jgi:hypothetical protein
MTAEFRNKLCHMELDFFDDKKYVSTGGMVGCRGEYTIDRLKSDEYLVSDGVMAKIESSDTPIRRTFGIIARQYDDGYFKMFMNSHFNIVEMSLKDTRHRFLPGLIIDNSYCELMGHKFIVDLQRKTDPHEYLEIVIDYNTMT